MARDDAGTFRRLHQPGRLLRLANVWDAGSARLVESCGAEAIATTSAGLAWSRGYPDGGALPPRALAAALAEIARVLSIPLTADVEGGYSTDPAAVGETVRAVIDAGAVGINIEDGSESPELACAKIEAAKTAGARAGVDLFVNLRCDVFLRSLVPPDRLVAETASRGNRYRAAGCDGLFVLGLRDPTAIAAIVAAVPLPINVMVVPGLPLPEELQALGVRRVSAGSGIAQIALGTARRAAVQFLDEGRYDAILDQSFGYGELNQLFAVVAKP